MAGRCTMRIATCCCWPLCKYEACDPNLAARGPPLELSASCILLSLSRVCVLPRYIALLSLPLPALSLSSALFPTLCLSSSLSSLFSVSYSLPCSFGSAYLVGSRPCPVLRGSVAVPWRRRKGSCADFLWVTQVSSQIAAGLFFLNASAFTTCGMIRRYSSVKQYSSSN